jgi:hypothetical protein
MATTTKGVPYPVGSDNNDAAADMQAMADWIDDALGAKTTAQIAALSGAALWEGRTILDSDTGDVMVYRDSTLGWVISGGVVGGIVWMADSSDPDGYFYCDGSSYNTTTYADLFAKIGGEFGSNLPDIRNRMVAGLGTESEFNVMGETGGAKTVTIASANLPTHTHTGPNHTHTGPNHSHGSGTLGTDTEADHIHLIWGRPSTGYGTWGPQLFKYYTSDGSGNQVMGMTDGITQLEASDGGQHSHSVTTGSTANDGTGLTGQSGTGATGNGGFANSALSILSPYITLKPYIKY